MVRTKWLASLSDGSIAIEDTAPFVGDETASPWAKLLAHLSEHGLTITGLRVQVSKDGEPVRTYNLPSFRKDTKTGQHDKWRVFPIDPVRYDYFRWATFLGLKSKRTMSHIEIRAIYEDFIVSLFVDEIEGNEAWVVVHENRARTAGLVR